MNNIEALEIMIKSKIHTNISYTIPASDYKILKHFLDLYPYNNDVCLDHNSRKLHKSHYLHIVTHACLFLKRSKLIPMINLLFKSGAHLDNIVYPVIPPFMVVHDWELCFSVLIQQKHPLNYYINGFIGNVLLLKVLPNASLINRFLNYGAESTSILNYNSNRIENESVTILTILEEQLVINKSRTDEIILSLLQHAGNISYADSRLNRVASDDVVDTLFSLQGR